MHFTDQWVILGVKQSKVFWLFFSLFAVALMLLSCIYSLILLAVLIDEYDRGLRQKRGVAPVSSHEGFPFTFPSAEVCVNH